MSDDVQPGPVEKTTEEPVAPDAPRYTVSSSTPVFCWVLQGPAGSMIDTLLSVLISGGATAEAITARTRYRLVGDARFLNNAADAVAKAAGHSLTIEQPPKDSVSFAARVEPARAPRRRTYVHGTTGAGFIARALDHRLQVSPVGINRWSVTGPSTVQMDWLANVQSKPRAQILSEFGVTEEAIACEDSTGLDVTIPVTVSLPARKTETQLIERDPAGNLTRVVQIERDA